MFVETDSAFKEAFKENDKAIKELAIDVRDNFGANFLNVRQLNFVGKND